MSSKKRDRQSVTETPRVVKRSENGFFPPDPVHPSSSFLNSSSTTTPSSNQVEPFSTQPLTSARSSKNNLSRREESTQQECSLSEEIREKYLFYFIYFYIYFF